MRKFGAVAGLIALCIAPCGKSKASPLTPSDLSPKLRLPIEKIVVFGNETRETVADYAQQNHLDAVELKHEHSGSGLIRCGNARGAGQLTLTDDVITTAAHVLYDDHGQLRAGSDRCQFVVMEDGQEIATAIDTTSIVAGSTNPYNESAVHDWAVARLAHPLRGATPYSLGAPSGGLAIRFVARGHSDWGNGREMSMENCRMRDGLEAGSEGTREFSFDCAAGVGASGGALLNAAGSRLLAVFVGYRTTTPNQREAFSNHNYNFAVTVEGAFRRAVQEVAAPKTAQSQ